MHAETRSSGCADPAGSGGADLDGRRGDIQSAEREGAFYPAIDGRRIRRTTYIRACSVRWIKTQQPLRRESLAVVVFSGDFVPFSAGGLHVAHHVHFEYILQKLPVGRLSKGSLGQ